MKINFKLVCCLASITLLIAGCKKEPGAQPQANTAPTATNSAPASTAAPATSAATPAAGDTTAETTSKLAGAAWALKQDEIKNDPNGQWAVQASASSVQRCARNG